MIQTIIQRVIRIEKKGNEIIERTTDMDVSHPAEDTNAKYKLVCTK